MKRTGEKLVYDKRTEENLDYDERDGGKIRPC